MNPIIRDKETIMSQSLLDDLSRACNIYDIIAACYKMLLNYINDTDIAFVSQVNKLSDDSKYCAYAETFEDFRQNIILLTEKININILNDDIGFEKFRDLLISELEQFQCPETMGWSDCISFCMFYTIEAIDIYLEKNLDNVLKSYTSFGPLNEEVGQECCLIYLQERNSFLSSAYKMDSSGFRKPLHSTRVGSVFHMVLMVERNKFYAAIPQIIPVGITEAFRQTIKNNAFRIASIPYIGFETFEFKEANSGKRCEPNQIPNGPFYVQYNTDNTQDNICWIKDLLELAVQEKANIIIFPEFIMSAEMLQAIKEKLRSMNHKKKEQLLMVLAGTHYKLEDVNKGNNILHIISANGIEIGCYYKYSPFIKQAEEQIHGTMLKSKENSTHPSNSKQFSDRTYIENCEILTNPGKECTLVDIELIGRILPAICRDVIDGKYTYDLANIFIPSLVMVPAWSNSVTSFDSRFSEFAQTIHTTSLLCNCCNAVRGEENEKKSIGRFMYPSKQNTYMKGIPLDIGREQSCIDSCKKNGGCIKMINVNFSQGILNAVPQTFFPKNSDIHNKMNGDKNDG